MDMFQLRQEAMAASHREGKRCTSAIAGMIAHDIMRDQHQRSKQTPSKYIFDGDVTL